MLAWALALYATASNGDPSPWNKVLWGADRQKVQESIAGLEVPETIFLQGVLGQQLGLEGKPALSGMDVIARYYFAKDGGLAVIKLVPADESQCDAFRRAVTSAFGARFSSETRTPEMPSDMGSIRRTWTNDRRIVTHIDILGVPWARERCNLSMHAPDFDRAAPRE